MVIVPELLFLLTALMKVVIQCVPPPPPLPPPKDHMECDRMQYLGGLIDPVKNK